MYVGEFVFYPKSLLMFAFHFVLVKNLYSISTIILESYEFNIYNIYNPHSHLLGECGRG